MEAIELDGTRYLKARDAARQTGYTADYIGQLCRAGEIDARMVGRSWYVNPEELSAHRAEKKRSVRAKAREQVKKSVAEQSAAAGAAQTAAHHAAAPQYETDTSDLFPTIHRSDAVTDTTAEAEELPVEAPAAEPEETDMPEEKVSPDEGESIQIQRQDVVTQPKEIPQPPARATAAKITTPQVTPTHEEATVRAAQKVRTQSVPSPLRTPAVALAALVLLAVGGMLAPMLETRWAYTFEDTPDGTAWTASTAYGIHLETVNIR